MFSEDSKDSFSARFKEAFGDARNKDIAEQLGVSKATITLYTSGRLPPSDMLLKVAQLTNCNLHWLLTGYGPKWALWEEHQHGKHGEIIALYHSAGGTGKSVAATYLAMSLARRNYKTLVVESFGDSYISASFFPTLFDIKTCLNDTFHFSDSAEYSEVYWMRDFFKTPVDGLDLFAGDIVTRAKLIRMGVKRFKVAPSELRQKYSFIIVDLNLKGLIDQPDLLRARLIMSAKILFSCDASRCDSGIEDCFVFLKNALEQSDEMEIFGAFANMADPRVRATKKVIKEIRHLLPDKALDTVIHRDITVPRSDLNQIGVHQISKRARIVREYDQLAEEIIRRTANTKI